MLEICNTLALREDVRTLTVACSSKQCLLAASEFYGAEISLVFFLQHFGTSHVKGAFELSVNLKPNRWKQFIF